MTHRSVLRQVVFAFGAAIPMIILPIAVLGIPLSAADALGLTSAETASWILAVYGLAGVLSIILAYWFQQPFLFTGNLFVLIFIASLAARYSFGELVGAAMVAGFGVVLITVFGLSERLAAMIPAPVVLGLLSGAVLPFVFGVFSGLNELPWIIGCALVAYMVGRGLLGHRVPAILWALIAGLLAAWLTGRIGQVSVALEWPTLVVTRPIFSLPALLTLAPVFLIVIAIQSNLPSLIFLRSQGYAPPDRQISLVSGVCTALGSLLGPAGLSLSLPATSLVAGPSAGEFNRRHWVVYIAGVSSVIVGLLSGLFAQVTVLIPLTFLLALAGLAAIDVLSGALQHIFQGPLRLGPVLAFAIALSDISLFGFGPFFWSLVVGGLISWTLEREGMAALRTGSS
jgi:benzoate membrane transport protein